MRWLPRSKNYLLCFVPYDRTVVLRAFDTPYHIWKFDPTSLAFFGRKLVLQFNRFIQSAGFLISSGTSSGSVLKRIPGRSFEHESRVVRIRASATKRSDGLLFQNGSLRKYRHWSPQSGDDSPDSGYSFRTILRVYLRFINFRMRELPLCTGRSGCALAYVGALSGDDMKRTVLMSLGCEVVKRTLGTAWPRYGTAWESYCLVSFLKRYELTFLSQ